MIHNQYARFGESKKAIVDDAYKAARQVLEDNGIQPSNTDPAERLVEAIAQYIIESGGFRG